VACGFKTQQHFAQVFREVCGTSPTEYRWELFGSGVAVNSVNNSDWASRISFELPSSSQSI